MNIYIWLLAVLIKKLSHQDFSTVLRERRNYQIEQSKRYQQTHRTDNIYYE